MVTDDKLAEFHSNFKKKWQLNSEKEKSFNIAEMKPVYADMIKLINYLGEDHARDLGKSWFKNIESDPNWMFDTLPLISIAWFQIMEIHVLHATNPSRTTVEALLIKINFVHNLLIKLKMQRFPGFKRFENAQKNITKEFSFGNVNKVLCSLQPSMQNVATIATATNELEMFYKSKMPPSETWHTIQFRLPMKTVEHPYSQLFPEDESETELEKSEKIFENDFTSDLEDETAQKIVESASYKKGSFGDFWEEFEKFNN